MEVGDFLVKGFWGRIARVDLSTKTIKYEEQENSFFRKYIGGVGLIAYYLFKELEPGVNPLGQGNKLIFAPGIVTGTGVPGASRICIGAKSPLTGAFGKAEVGGFCGNAIKQAGLDAIIVEGISDNPVYLFIHSGQVEIRNADFIWGKTTKESQAMLREQIGSNLVKTLLIGPAGENLVPISCIIDNLAHSAGRTGLGCVMGSKKLKGIAAIGGQSVPVYNKQFLVEQKKWVNQNTKILAERLFKWGTGADIQAFNDSGNIPTMNFRDSFFSYVDKITPMAMKEKLNFKKKSCYGCPIRCKKVVSSSEPYFVEGEYGGAEYETIASFGANCGISDIQAISKAHALCNAYSLDTISTGVVIAFAMECFEKGIINEKTTGGLRLDFGNVESMLKMIELIARREGIGEVLGKGVKKAAEIFGKGAANIAVHVKGLEMAMHEPRLKQGLGIGYAVAFQGADHGIGLHDTFFVNYSKKLEQVNALGIYEPLPVDYLGPEKVMLFSALGCRMPH